MEKPACARVYMHMSLHMDAHMQAAAYMLRWSVVEACTQLLQILQVSWLSGTQVNACCSPCRAATKLYIADDASEWLERQPRHQRIVTFCVTCKGEPITRTNNGRFQPLRNYSVRGQPPEATENITENCDGGAKLLTARKSSRQ